MGLYRANINKHLFSGTIQIRLRHIGGTRRVRSLVVPRVRAVAKTKAEVAERSRFEA